MEIQGHPLEDGDTVAFEQDFLDTIMEINEEILEVQNQSDLERLKERNQLVLQDLFKLVDASEALQYHSLAYVGYF